jgi:hypothetical protein
MPTKTDQERLLHALGPFLGEIHDGKGWVTTIEIDVIKLYDLERPDGVPKTTKAGNFVIAVGFGKEAEWLKNIVIELKNFA